MKKINYILTLLLLAVGVNWAKADDQTLALGNYDDLTAYDCVENQTYQGSWWMVAPTQLQVKHTGAQIIYTKEQLASMKGKEIKGISFKYYNLAAFQAYPRTINVWVKEIDDNAFVYSEAKKSYCYFENILMPPRRLRTSLSTRISLTPTMRTVILPSTSTHRLPTAVRRTCS